VIIGNGEQIEALDLELVAGSVITGTVVRSDGKPVVEEEIQLKRTDNKPIARFYSGFSGAQTIEVFIESMASAQEATW
jgi:hypothetical protein